MSQCIFCGEPMTSPLFVSCGHGLCHDYRVRGLGYLEWAMSGRWARWRAVLGVCDDTRLTVSSPIVHWLAAMHVLDPDGVWGDPGLMAFACYDWAAVVGVLEDWRADEMPADAGELARTVLSVRHAWWTTHPGSVHDFDWLGAVSSVLDDNVSASGERPSSDEVWAAIVRDLVQWPSECVE